MSEMKPFSPKPPLKLLPRGSLREGGRLRRRRWEFRPEHRVGVGREASVMTAGYPARQDLLARIERVRLLELEEGIRRPVEDHGPDARASRRRVRAEMLHNAGAGDQRREDGSIQLDGRERVHGMGARGAEAATEGCGLGVGVQQHQRGDEMGTVAPARGSDGSQQNLASLRGNDTDAAAAGGDASSASGGNAGGHVGSNSDTHTHTFTHAWGVGVVAG